MTAASASLALSIKSGASVTMAFSFGFKASMRFKCATAMSTGETARVRTSSISSTAERDVRSVVPDAAPLP